MSNPAFGGASSAAAFNTTLGCALAVVSGAFMIAVINNQNTAADPTSVTDSQLNTWTKVASLQTGQTGTTSIWTATASATGTNTLTSVVASSATQRIMMAYYTSTTGLSDAIPVVNAQYHPAAGADTVLSASITPSVGNCLICAYTLDGNGIGIPTTGTTPNAFTSDYSSGTLFCNLEHYQQTTAAAIQATFGVATATSATDTFVWSLAPTGGVTYSLMGQQCL